MALAEYVLECDWNGDGSYTHAEADVTADLGKFRLIARRGRKYASMVYGRSEAGKLKFKLRNTDGNKYDRFNASSPLHGLIEPQRMVRLGMVIPGVAYAPVARAKLAAGSDLFPTGGTIESGGDVTLAAGLTIGRLVWSSTASTLTMYRASSETVSMGAFWDTGGGGENLSVYITNDGGRTTEIPYGAITSRAAASVVWTLTGDAYAAHRALLSGIASGDQYWTVVDKADVWLSAIAVAVHPLWGGYLDKPTRLDERGGRDQVEIRALGIISKLVQTEAEASLQTDYGTGAAFGKILDSAGITAEERGTIATGLRTMSKWWARRQQALRNARDIEQTELGFIHEDRRGRIAFDAEYYRLNQRTSVATLSDTPMTGAIPIIAPAKPTDPTQDITNIVQTTVRQFTVANVAVLWTLQEKPLLKPGVSRTFIAEYPTVDSLNTHLAVDTWTTFVAYTDYVANASADNTGTNLTGSLGVTSTETAVSRTITVTNNHASSDLYVTKLQARGQALVSEQPYTVEVKDQDSIDKYGPREYAIPSQFISDSSDAEDYGLVILHLQRDPARKLEATININDGLETGASLDLSDRVTVHYRGTVQDMFIEAIEHRILPAGLRHDVKLLLSPSLPYGQIIVLGVGPGLGTGVLGR